MVPWEEERKSKQARKDISVERPKIDNGQDSQDIDFGITKLDGKAYDRNGTIANNVRILCKLFKGVTNDTQCVVCKRYFRGNRRLNQHLI